MCSLTNDGQLGFDFPFSEVLSPSCNGPVAAPRVESHERVVLVGAAVDGGARRGQKLWLETKRARNEFSSV
jgi:hypothetical protein